MERRYWELFWRTGSPLIWLLSRYGGAAEEGERENAAKHPEEQESVVAYAFDYQGPRFA